ncbi:MAG: phage protease, partial [Treponemataceae bacterium]
MENHENGFFIALHLNSAGLAPAKIQILPAGDLIKGFDGRWWTATDKQAIINATKLYLENLVIDENHASDLAAIEGKPTPARGWFSNLSLNEAGEIWADVEWTSEGKALVESKSYRYISPVFTSKNNEIQTILRAALTNTPNLTQLAALNTEGADKNKTKELSMDKIKQALGLALNASEADVLTKIGQLQMSLNTQAVDLTAYAPRADLNAMSERAVKAETALAELNAASLKAQAESLVSKA